LLPSRTGFTSYRGKPAGYQRFCEPWYGETSTALRKCAQSIFMNQHAAFTGTTPRAMVNPVNHIITIFTPEFSHLCFMF
jgi:hypothetical protein